MPTFRYKKLVRDNIRKFHETKGHAVTGSVLSGAELRQALCEKLHEEADEVNAALSRDELIEEIADVRQILDDLCRVESIDQAEVQTAQQEKADKKGGFMTGQFIDTVTINDASDEWVAYCRARPDKYPEVPND